VLKRILSIHYKPQGVFMKKLFSVLVLASMLSTATVHADEVVSYTGPGALLTTLLVLTTLLKTDSNGAVVNALEESEKAGSMTPVLRSFVDDVKATASLKGLSVSDEEVISSLEAAALN
jgi:hypothetical protein